MSHKHSNRTNMVQRKKRKAFSLVELVVVILIIAILAAAVFLGGATVIRQARERQVQSDLRNFGTYVQDMLYDNPGLQYHSDYSVGENFTFDATTTTITLKDEAGTADPAKMLVLKMLNDDYLTADFQLVNTVDAWKNPYCFSYDQLASDGTGKSSSCIIVINSLGQNSLDETSDGALAANAEALVTPATADSTKVAGAFVNATDGMASDAKYRKWDSAQAYVDALGDLGVGDDYGVVIVMIDGQVSVAYYGF